MKVEKYFEKILSKRKIHLTLIDPEEQEPKKALEIAKLAIKGGTDGIMVGGSTSDQEDLDTTVKILKMNLNVPIILFPGNITGISKYADAIFFMSLLNSTNPYWITGAQALGAPTVKKYGIEALPVAYLIIEPGGTVSWVGDAKPIPRKKYKLAAAYAMAAELLGMKYVYLEAGSGAKHHVPTKMISKVRDSTNLKIIVGGGIKTREDVERVIKAGADIIVTGTIIERASDIKKKISEIVEPLKSTSNVD